MIHVLVFNLKNKIKKLIKKMHSKYNNNNKMIKRQILMIHVLVFNLKNRIKKLMKVICNKYLKN